MLTHQRLAAHHPSKCDAPTNPNQHSRVSLLVLLSPAGYVMCRGLGETACRGLNWRALARVLAQSKVIFIQVLAD